MQYYILLYAVSYTHLDVYKRQSEDRFRERGSLPATFYVLRRVIFSLTNDNCRAFKQNQIMFCIQPRFVEYSRPIGFGEDRLRERGSLLQRFMY